MGNGFFISLEEGCSLETASFTPSVPLLLNVTEDERREKGIVPYLESYVYKTKEVGM